MPTSKQRRDAARRHLERQLAKREQREARRRMVTLISTVVGVLVVFAVVITSIVMLTHDNKKSTASPAASATASASASASASATVARVPGVCAYATGPTASRKVTRPPGKAPTKGIAVATVVTNRGSMTFTMDRAKAPCTVENFVSLAKQKFFDKTPCPRVTTSAIFVLQCGDPTGTGAGGPGYSIIDEYKGTEKYTRGVLAMANTGAANSGGSQFFIVYQDTVTLPAKYTVFGSVTKGLAVVDKVAAAGSNNKNQPGDGNPKLSVEITSVTVAG